MTIHTTSIAVMSNRNTPDEDNPLVPILFRAWCSLFLLWYGKIQYLNQPQRTIYFITINNLAVLIIDRLALLLWIYFNLCKSKLQRRLNIVRFLLFEVIFLFMKKIFICPRSIIGLCLLAFLYLQRPYFLYNTLQ